MYLGISVSTDIQNNDTFEIQKILQIKKDAQVDVIHKSVSNFRLQVHFKHKVYHGNHCLHFYCIFTFKKCSRKFLPEVSWENVSAAEIDLQDNVHQLYQTSFKSTIMAVILHVPY